MGVIEYFFFALIHSFFMKTTFSDESQFFISSPIKNGVNKLALLIGVLCIKLNNLSFGSNRISIFFGEVQCFFLT